MSIDHNLFVEDIVNLLTDDENTQDPAEIMDAIVRIVDDYKSELLLEETERIEEEATLPFEVASEDNSLYSKPIIPIEKPKRAFMMEKAKKQYYKENGITEDDEADFSILEKNAHRQKINEIVYKLMLEDGSDGSTVLTSKPFSVVRRASDNEEAEDLDDDDNYGAARSQV